MTSAVARTGRPLPAGFGVAAMFVAMLAIGGAGIAYPTLLAIVEQIAIALLVAATVRHLALRRSRVDRLKAALIVLAMAIPAAQLVPIPFPTWAALPGRALPAEILIAIGATAARPLSLDPRATIAALLALLPALAMFVAGRGLGASARRLALRCVIGVAVSSTCLGAAQLLAGATANAPAFASAHLGQAIGLFVNRNHQATLLLVAICLCAPGGERAAVRSGWLALGLIVLLAAGVVATTSRTALILLPLCLLAGADRLPRWRAVAWPGAAVVSAAFAALVWWGGLLSPTLARFGGEPDVRWAFWRTTWQAAQAYWPFGSGIGSFKAVYPLFEARADLAPYFVNHAHNDYLELLLEGGAAAIVALALFGWWLVRCWRARDAMPGVLAALAVMLTFSAVEYPLRTLSLAAVFGLLCALARTPERAGGVALPAKRAITASLAIVVLAVGMVASLAIWRQQPPPLDARARLAQMPTDQQALTLLALSGRPKTDLRREDALLALAARLGWRDATTQLVLIAREGAAGHATAAVERADALLRTEQQQDLTIRTMRLAVDDPDFRDALATALAGNPPWRRTYLTRLDDFAAPLDPHAALLQAMAARGAPPSLEERAALVRRALALGDAGMVAVVWRAAGSALPDPALRRIDSDGAARNGLFGWHKTDIDSLHVEPSPTGGPTVLAIDGGASGLLLYQDLLLPPGDYHVAIAVKADDGVGDARWSLTCAVTGRRLDAVVPYTNSGWAFVASVPADCPVQRLGLYATGGTPDTVRLRIGPATLQPMPPVPPAARALNRN